MPLWRLGAWGLPALPLPGAGAEGTAAICCRPQVASGSRLAQVSAGRSASAPRDPGGSGQRSAGLSFLGGPGSVGSAYAWGFVSRWGGARVSAIASR